MTDPRRTAQIDQLSAAIRDKNADAAGEVIERIAKSDPLGAQNIVDGLIQLGHSQENP